VARYRVGSTQSRRRNFAYPGRTRFDSTDKRGEESFGLTSRQLHAIYTGCQTAKKRRLPREER